MTPIWLNPTTPCDHDEHIFLSPFKNHRESLQHDEFKVYKRQYDESSDLQLFSSSSTIPTINDDSVNTIRSPIVCGGNGDHNKNSNGLTLKWMSSKTRLMQKMMNSNSTQHKFQDQQQSQHYEHASQMNYLENGPSGIIRVCNNCNTTKTPLWRGGPSGLKSLCNACGIRQRKARQAMEAAAAMDESFINTTMRDTSSSSSSTIKTTKKMIKKDSKKACTHLYVAQYKKKQCKLIKDHGDVIKKYDDQISTNKKNCFEDFALNLFSKNSSFRGVFSQDEEEGAILLMALSCGLG